MGLEHIVMGIWSRDLTLTDVIKSDGELVIFNLNHLLETKPQRILIT